MHKTDLPIAAPCHAEWNAMKRGDKSRFCGECKKTVHDLTKLTRHEAKALLASLEWSGGDEGLCVRYLHDELGHVAFVDTFRDRSVPPSALLRKVAKVAVATALLAVPMSLTACMGAMERPSPPVAPSTVAPDPTQGDAGQGDAGPPSTAASTAAPVSPLAK